MDYPVLRNQNLRTHIAVNLNSVPLRKTSEQTLSVFLDRRTKFNSLIVRSLCTYEGQSLLKIGKSRNEISKAFLPIPQKNATEGRLLRSSQLSLADVKTNVLGMLQDDVLQKHMKKNFIQSSKQRGISRKRKGNCGVVARWLMVLGGQTATCAFALANNNAARALNDVRPSVDVAVAVPSFIISPFGPSFYPLTSIRATLRFIHHVRLQSANIRTDVPAIGRRQTHSHTPSPMYVHSTG